jgi:hypothetical protein
VRDLSHVAYRIRVFRAGVNPIHGACGQTIQGLHAPFNAYPVGPGQKSRRVVSRSESMACQSTMP